MTLEEAQNMCGVGETAKPVGECDKYDMYKVASIHAYELGLKQSYVERKIKYIVYDASGQPICGLFDI